MFYQAEVDFTESFENEFECIIESKISDFYLLFNSFRLLLKSLMDCIIFYFTMVYYLIT